MHLQSVVIIALAASATVRDGRVRAQSSSQDDALIYSTVVEQIVGKHAVRVLIRSTSRADAGWVEPGSGMIQYVRHLPGLDSLVADDFERTNRSPSKVPLFKIGDAAVELLDDSTKTIPKADGIVSVTGIGYSSDGRQAVVAVEYICGAMCGGGEVAVLEKVEGAWKMTQKGGVIWVH